jgi:hypothetical protein
MFEATDGLICGQAKREPTEGKLKEFPWVNRDPTRWSSLERNRKPTPATKPNRNSPKGRSITRTIRSEKKSNFYRATPTEHLTQKAI